MHTSRIAAVVIAALALAPTAASAQDGYPSKPVRIILPAAGGGSDFVARLLAPRLSEAFGQQFIVDNRGAISADLVAKAAPDGYTLHVNGSPAWVLPLMRPSSWDALRDFAPVTMAVTSPNILTVHPSLPVTNAKELIALARAKPGQLNYAAGTIGATPHLAAELFKAMTGLDIVRVPYKGSGPALIGLITGEAQIMFPAASGIEYMKQGKIKALAVGSLERSALLPGVPTLAESGVPGYESIAPQSVFAPAKTPPAIVERLQREIARVLNMPDVKDRLTPTGVEVVASTPGAFAAWIRTDIERTVKLIKTNGIREEKE
jgi:tripartite-type tricarboxylate transporter receptor subunit TctC